MNAVSPHGESAPAESAPAGRLEGTLVSVNVGMPRDVPWQGKTVFTGVFKEPVAGPRRVRRLNVDGDGQGDLAGHGGEQRAVFVYQLDSYRYWERELARTDFVYGQFGENFTVEGLSDDEVCIGDRYRIGTAVFEVTPTARHVLPRRDPDERPAHPCAAGLAPAPRLLLPRARTKATFERATRSSSSPPAPEAMTVAEVDGLLYLPGHARQQLLRALRLPALSPGWQASFRALLEAKPGSGNAGLAAASPPPVWPGFRRLRVTGIERETDSVISIRLEDPGGTPLPPRAPASTSRCGFNPTATERSVLRNYSLSGPTDAGYYRISVKREHDGTGQRVSPHPARRRRSARRRSTAWHLHPRRERHRRSC